MQNNNAHCPQCGKAFDTESQVRRHLDQPRAKCHRRPTIFVDPADLLEEAGFYLSTPDVPLQQRPRKRPHTPDSDEESSDQDSRDDNMQGAPAEQSRAPVIDFFPEVASVVDQNGTKFIDAFDQDTFSEMRNSENLYYPFANRLEWELAEYLLTSELSMAAIDRFFSLTLVCFPSVTAKFPPTHSYFRSNNFDSRSIPHQSFVDSRRCYPRFLPGSAVALTPRTPRKEL